MHKHNAQNCFFQVKRRHIYGNQLFGHRASCQAFQFLNQAHMKLLAKENACEGDHDIREHSDVEEQGGSQMKEDNQQISRLDEAWHKQQKGNNKIVEAAKPAEDVGH